MKEDYAKYISQRNSAIRRNLEWNLTFDEWLHWWKSTGKYDKRGRKGHEYCMCRFGDKGPYSLNNIYCATNNQNTKDARLNNRFPPKSKNFNFNGRKHSAQSLEKISKNNASTLSQDEITRRLKILENFNMDERGFIKNYANAINVSHTQARKFLNKYYIK